MHYTLLSREKKLRDGICRGHDPIVFFVDELMYQAIEMRASDIHLEPMLECVRVRYRIDGMLYEQKPIAKEKAGFVISRLKILASLDIAQRRLPQDGKLMILFDGLRGIDVRIATFPTVFGEKVVIRILDQHWHHLSFHALGCNQEVIEKIERVIAQPHGFFLVTGPTGSGKTTTLYALLSVLNTPERHIMTMEDPVEYHIEGVMQSQIDEKIGFTFERGLRALVRQDPDVAMVGEVRDSVTAQIAIEAALTGHLVLSSLHTNDAVGAITRLLDMGIEPFLVTASVTAVLAQRLVRLLCEACKERRLLDDVQRALVDENGWDIEMMYGARGCDACQHLGHKGRTGVFELFVVDDEVRHLVMQGASERVIREHAFAHGMTMLQDDVIAKVKQGMISFDELVRYCR